MTVSIPVVVVVFTPLTATTLAAYLEQMFPGLSGPNVDKWTAGTIAEFNLVARYPTIADLDKLFARTVAARASILVYLQSLPNVQKPNALTQLQQLNFAMFTGDPIAYGVVDFRGDPGLKAKIDAAKALVTT